jgi:hypothetical protein
MYEALTRMTAEITAQPMERLNMDSAAEMGSDTEQAEALSLLGCQPWLVGRVGLEPTTGGL